MEEEDGNEEEGDLEGSDLETDQEEVLFIPER